MSKPVLQTSRPIEEHVPTLVQYGFQCVGRLCLDNNSFQATLVDDSIGKLPCCIYVFVIGEEIVRIGSSKAPLRDRMRGFARSVTHALNGRRAQTPLWEAICWRDRLQQHGDGTIYARQGHPVTTPIGTFNAYLDEESLLLGMFRPRLNRHHHR